MELLMILMPDFYRLINHSKNSDKNLYDHLINTLSMVVKVNDRVRRRLFLQDNVEIMGYQ